MIKIQFLGMSPVDVDGFPKSVERTLKGALHLKPNRVYSISEGEFAHVKEIRPDLKFYVFKIEKLRK